MRIWYPLPLVVTFFRGHAGGQSSMATAVCQAFHGNCRGAVFFLELPLSTMRCFLSLEEAVSVLSIRCLIPREVEIRSWLPLHSNPGTVSDRVLDRSLLPSKYLTLPTFFLSGNTPRLLPSETHEDCMARRIVSCCDLSKDVRFPHQAESQPLDRDRHRRNASQVGHEP